jgi:hypothetical protein
LQERPQFLGVGHRVAAQRAAVADLLQTDVSDERCKVELECKNLSRKC